MKKKTVRGWKSGDLLAPNLGEERGSVTSEPGKKKERIKSTIPP